MPKIHDLKILPTYFDDVAKGRKTFELRFDDRGYFEGVFVLRSQIQTKSSGAVYSLIITICPAAV